MEQKNVDVVITGTAQETDTNMKEDSYRKKKMTVSREVDFTFENYTDSNPNIDRWCDREFVYQTVKHMLMQRENDYHSIEIDSVTVTFYDIVKQAREFASERPNMSVSEAMNKMKELEYQTDIRT